MINNVVIVGRLTKAPELRYTPNGVAVTGFTLAVNRRFTNQQGERDADFVSVVVWRKSAESSAKYLKKGSLAGVEGRLQTRNYENSEGIRIYITEVVAEHVQFLEPKGTRGGSQEAPQNADDPFANDGKPINISDDDMPF